MISFKKQHVITIFLMLSMITSTIIAEKRALIVAIGKYPIESGWKTINSENDVTLIKSSLKKQGFNDQNIDIIINEKATKTGIEKAFNSLINSTHADDIVVFHFSGHGQQVTDTNGDEVDGLDEALIPYDAEKTNKKGARQAGSHLLDDELNILLGKLRLKVGSKGDVLVFIDACHSGTATRGTEIADTTAIYRGTNEVYLIPGYEKVKSRGGEKNLYEEELPATRSGSSALSPLIILSACSAEQINKEYAESGKRYGSLSYALSKVLNKSISTMSYVAFFEAVRSEFPLMTRSNYQTPQMEGNAERKVFAGNTVEIPQYFTVIKVLSDGRTVINAGTMVGIFPGTEISFYPSDTYDTKKSKPIAVCKVDSSLLFESALSLGANINRKQIQNSWAFVTQYRYRPINSTEGVDEMRARILRNAKSAAGDVQLEIVPINKSGKQVSLASKTKNGNVEFKNGDRFLIKVSNNDNKPIYFQLVDVMPNNNIALATNKAYRNDYCLKPGQSKLFTSVEIEVSSATGLGMETFVLIASEKQLDLSAIENKKSQPKRGDTSEFEEFLNELYTPDRSMSIFQFNKVNIATKSFIVKAK